VLVLSRKVGESILIGADVVVQVLEVRRGEARLGISAPAAVPIRRSELPAHRRAEPTPLGAAADPGRPARSGPSTASTTSSRVMDRAGRARQ
jgi:carbon storage regulator